MVSSLPQTINTLNTGSGYFPDGQLPASITPSAERALVNTLQKRTPQFRSTDPEYGAIGDGSSHPLSGIPAFAAATSPAGLAAIVVGGATPYSWATLPLYGLTFTKTTTASSTAGSFTLTLGSSGGGVSGDLQNPAQYIVAGMTATGTNIPGGATVASFTYTATNPNKVDGPCAGTVTLSAAVTGAGVANGATITFAYSSTLMQALQMDWVGIQAAEYAAGLPATGGRHHTPGGNYIVNRTIIRSDTAVGNYFVNQSSWVGDGMVATRLNWTADSGYGTWAVTPPDRFSPGNLGLCDMRDIILSGPGVGTTMGATNTKMQGLAVGYGFFGLRIACQGFYCGLHVTSDHQCFINCFFQNDYIGVYYGPYAAQNTGDQSFIDCFMDGNTFCSVGVSGTNQIVATTFLRCHTGFSPYAFYKETGSVTNFLINSTFIRLSQEAFGNGCILDENAAGLISGCVWEGCDMALDTTNFYEIAANTTYAAIRCGNMTNCFFFGEADPYAQGYNRTTRPYTTAIIQTQQGLSNTKFWNAASLVAAGTSTLPSVVAGFAVAGADVRWDSGAAAGTFRTTSGALTANVFVSTTDFGVAKALSATNPAPIGLAMYAASGSIATACVAVADYGVVTVNKTTSTDVITAGKYLQINSTTDGSVVVFNSAARTSCVGIVWNATSSGQTTLLMEVSIKGP